MKTLSPALAALATLLLSANSHAAELSNISLKTKAPGNNFALCAMEVTNRDLIKTDGRIQLINSRQESKDRPTSLASIRIYVTEPNLLRAQIFKIVMRSSDRAKGWQAINQDGETYFSTAKAESVATLFLDEEPRDMGDVDLSECQN